MDNKIVISEATTIPKTIEWIKNLTFEAATHPEIQQLAKEALQTPDPEKYIFDYAYNKMLYEPNEGSKQQLRTVWNFLRTGKGNCTSYSELIGAALLNAGIPFRYRVVNYPTKDKSGRIIYPDEYQHVYIVTKNKVLDPVIGHKQDGTDTRINRPKHGQYNKELPFYKQIDFPMSRLEILQGTIGRTVDPRFRTLISNRSKLSRYGILSGCGCNQDNLNGGFGDFLTNIGNAATQAVSQYASKNGIPINIPSIPTSTDKAAIAAAQQAATQQAAAQQAQALAAQQAAAQAAASQQALMLAALSPKKDDNTMLYVGLGAAGLLAASLFLKPSNKGKK